MATVRELVTLLRYQVDDSGLRQYQDAYQAVQAKMAAISSKTVQAMRQVIVGTSSPQSEWATRHPPMGQTPVPMRVPGIALQAPSLPTSPAVPAGLASLGRPAAFPVDVGAARGKMAQIQGAYSGLLGRMRGGLHNIREAGIGAWEGVQLGIQDARRAQQRLTRAQWQGVRVIKEQQSAFSGLRGIVGAVLGVSLVKRIFGDIDAWGQMEARMRQATSSAKEYGEVDKDLARISRLTYKSYASNAGLFVRTRRSMADLGKSTQDTLDVTEALSLGMVLSSTKAQDQEAVISSLTAGIMQGKLAMLQYGTLMRAAPRLQAALADGLRITTDELLAQVKAGTVTTDRFLPALQTQLAKMRIEAESMPVTVADAMTVWNDAFERFFGKTLTAGRTVVLGVTKSIEFMADHIATLVKLLALTGATWGLVKLRGWLRLATFQSGGLTRSLIGAARAAVGLDSAMALRRGPAGALRMLSIWKRTLAPLLRMAAILTTIYLIGDDIAGWLRGDISVTGELIGRVEEWREEIDAVKTALVYVKDLLGGAGQELGPWIKKWGTVAVLAYGLWKILSPVRGLIMFLARTAVPLLWRAFAMTPIGRIITGVVLLATTLWEIWKNWDQIKARIAASWEALKAKVKGTFLEPVLQYFEELWAFWSKIFKGVIAAFKGDWDGAIKHWREAFSGVWTYFEDIGGKMIAKIKEIGGAIQTWINDKVEAAKNWFKGLLPPDADEETRAIMTGGRRGPSLADRPAMSALINGGTVPFISGGTVAQAGAFPGRGAVTVENRTDITINAPNSNPDSVASATQRGMNVGRQRTIDAMTRFFVTGVEEGR
ncbi:tape measure protein [Achromobacter sp. PAB15]|uniref:tape measure protein n=1 Tax=Achromobacter sp. PAB15 TaxID=3233048 RepID=UPI003F914828